MNCLILAAGHGSRIRPLAESKPLTPLAGTPLIEHVVTGAAAAGAGRFVLVTGHRGAEVEEWAAGAAGRLGLAIETARTPDWNRPNGWSLATGAERIAGDYLLLMADHLFDPAIVRRLLRRCGGRAELTLAVDRDIASPLIDLDDATRVALAADGAILRIGKGLTPFDAVDTGIFLAGPSLRAAVLDDAAQGGGGSLSEAVQRLADRGAAATVDSTGSWWIDVDDPRSHALAEAALAARLRDNAA